MEWKYHVLILFSTEAKRVDSYNTDVYVLSMYCSLEDHWERKL